MCGLAFAYNFKGHTVNEKIEHIYQNQVTRGQEGYGLAVLARQPDNTEVMKVYRQTQENNFLIDLKLRLGHMILAHHRTPTSSENKIDQTHPILVSNGSLKFDYLVVHNGIIHNKDILRAEHEKLGFLYTTLKTERKYPHGSLPDLETKFNDSESLAIELARYMEAQIEAPKAAGTNAFILLQLQKATAEETEMGLLGQPLQLAFGHNFGNPLRMGRNNDQIIIASEQIGTEIPENKIHFLNLLEPKSKMIILDVILPNYTFVTSEKTIEKRPYLGFGQNREFEDDLAYPENYGALSLYDKNGLPIIRTPTPDDGSEANVTALDNQIKTTNDEVWKQLYELIYDFLEECNDSEFSGEPEQYIERMNKEMQNAIEMFKPLMIGKARELELQEEIDARIDNPVKDKATDILVNEEIAKSREARKKNKPPIDILTPGCGIEIQALKEKIESQP